jgi:hypothetical protein
VISRRFLQGLVLASIGLCIGVAGTAAVLAYIPDAGSPPSIFDDFNWSSTANGFWHVNPVGGDAIIKNGLLTLSGHSVELDKRVQTDPLVTVASIRVRAIHFGKFGFGIGLFHSGTIGMEFDSDGIKCGRGTDFGYRIDFVLTPQALPVPGQWYYLQMSLKNPYPNPADDAKASLLPAAKRKKIRFVCSVYNSSGRLLGQDIAVNPPPNTHYAALDEAYMRTWDSGNNYQVDWVYVGSRGGDPLVRFVSSSAS